MSYKQVKTPNLDPIIYQNGKILYNWLGYCLAYAQTAFGAGWAGSSAWHSWESVTNGKNTGEEPIGVYIPLWFDGWWNGNRYGHVVIAKFNSNGSGSAWSSPFTNSAYPTRFDFADINHLKSIIKTHYGQSMNYVGWSTHVGPTQVIEWVEPIKNITLEQLKALFLEILERPLGNDQGAVNYYVGKFTYDYVRNDILRSPERNQLLAKKEADRLAVEEAKRKAEELRLAAEKAAAEAKAKKEREEAERLAEEARRAQEEADRLAEEERKKKEEQAKEQIGDADSSDEPFTAPDYGLLNRLMQAILSLINKLFNKEK